jgi:hypothetical protein
LFALKVRLDRLSLDVSDEVCPICARQKKTNEMTIFVNKDRITFFTIARKLDRFSEANFATVENRKEKDD